MQTQRQAAAEKLIGEEERKRAYQQGMKKLGIRIGRERVQLQENNE